MAGLQNLDIGITAFDPVVAAVLLLDELGVTATRAYSTRKLRSAYAGSAIRIRRSSDNAEQDIGFSGENLDTAAITTFVGANSAYVVTWYDQSGTGDNATQAVAANQARIVNVGTLDTKNGKPTPLFDGTSDKYASGSNLGNYHTASAVLATSLAGPNFSTYHGVMGTTASYEIINTESGTPNFREGPGTWFVHVNNVSSPAAVFGGVLMQVRWFSASAPFSGPEPVSIGWDRVDPRWWPGWIGEIIVFAADLSAPNDTAMYNNQKAYWGTP